MSNSLAITQSQAPDTEPDLIAQYIPLVHFLGEAMGSSCEVVLHDLSVPDESIVAIANGHISGRELGGPVTNFALWFMRQGIQDEATSMTGYRAVNSEGRVCRSSSYFIRDAAGELKAMLCINVDVTELMRARTAINSIIDTVAVSSKPAPTGNPSAGAGAAGAGVDAGTDAGASVGSNAGGPGGPDVGGTINVTELARAFEQSAADTLHGGITATATPIQGTSARGPAAPANDAQDVEGVDDDGTPVMEDLRSNLESMLVSMLDTAIATQDIPTEHMRSTERIQVVKALDEAGFFLLKGGIAAAAERLGVSEPTVYRYLVKARA